MLSLSMIVRNEEARLGECLRSVQGFADELVVVDTGSTDATVAIAEAAGARVEQIPWPGDFAPARNQALDPNNAACHQNNAVAQLLGGNIDAARSSFIRAINLLQVQGDTDAANQLREQVQGIVKLDGGAVA